MTEQKFKAGDLVTFKLTGLQASHLNGGHQDLVHPDEIVRHEPAPFDWKDVKPGMGFLYNGRNLITYIGRDMRGRYLFDFYGFGEYGSFDAEGVNKLTRAPEHDKKEMLG